MVAYTKHDLQFILDGITVSESHAAQTNTVDLGAGTWTVADLETSRQILLDLIPNSLEPIGMRTISGEVNNLVIGQENFGATGEFPRLLDPDFRTIFVDPDGPGGSPPVPMDYTPGVQNPGPGGLAPPGDVLDPTPRTISNLIVDQSVNNPVAVFAAEADSGAESFFGDDPTTPFDEGADDTFGDGVELIDPDSDVIGDEFFFIPNTAPDEGLSAPFNAWMTFFGQFFDHGLDLVGKGGSGTVFMPLQADDPLFEVGSPTNFMVLTRATVNADGVLGDDPLTPQDESLDDTEATNLTSPFVDQNQTYTSHPSHQIFVRQYEANGALEPVATGHLIEGASGGMATWGEVKAQARDLLGIELTDAEALDIPLFAVDQYGEFLAGANGLPQFVIELQNGAGDVVGTTLIEGVLPAVPGGSGLSLADAVADAQASAGAGLTAVASLTGFSFLVDIAHTAAPVFDDVTGALAPDPDMVAGSPNDPPPPAGTYDDELLDAHFIAGDGRANENIALTAVHHVFHQEHNRLVEHTKESLLSDENLIDLATFDDPTGEIAALELLNGYLLSPVGAFPANQAEIDALVWNGDRLFQAAKFGTEMQYQHLVFEEFGRKVQPLIDLFASYESSIDAAIVAEFAHTVYRFGHSMLTENVDLMAPDGTLTEVGLIEAFLNPIGFNQFINSDGTVDAGDILLQDSSIVAGALARGLTRETGNQIDEFVTEALRNNLLGLPLDLPAINLARGRDTGIPSLNDARADFFEGTGDTKLKPYDNWVDFALNLKNGGASIVNFVASYGTHELVTTEVTLEGKRAAALAITTGIDQDILDDVGAVVRTIVAPTDRLDFLNSTNTSGGPVDWSATETGLNLVDFWIGGLAEAIEPFGGMLGSTFNFVFEQQMEDLQDGDRFYYLGRTAGLNFLSQLEQNSFANMIIRNTDIGDIPGGDHLPGDIFATPAWILEVDQSRQVTGVGDPATVAALAVAQAEFDAAQAAFDIALANDLAADQNHADVVAAATADAVITPAEQIAIDAALAAALVTQAALLAAQAVLDTETTELAAATAALAVTSNADPTGDGASGGELNPFLDLDSNSLVIRADLDNDGDNDLLHYTGGDHVVLGGTQENDTIIGGIGDDTLWGDGGDDDLEGGDGGDIILGGEGDDVITDIGGPNNLQGQGGNDAIFAGGGESLILGGSGQDFILQGPDFAETFGGLGNDFIHAGDESNIVFGNEGNDWLEGGGGNNLLVGDNGDPFLSSTAGGHDVLISGLGDDDYDAEGGDDIMEGADGVQRFEGVNGFDWATYMNVDQGVSVDMLLRAFDETPIPASNVSIMDRFASVEGLSGSRGNDILRGENVTEVEQRSLDNGNNSVLRNFDLIDGLRGGADGIFASGATEWAGGEIMLGGAGNDIIEGRGGNDIIDGDLKLDASLDWTARDDLGAVIATGSARGMLGELVVETGALPVEITTLNEAVFARVINPGDIEIVREIIDESDPGGETDTAVFSDVRANYTIDFAPVAPDIGPGFISVTHNNAGVDGVDFVRNVERLQFADQTIVLDTVPPINGLPTGAATIVESTPEDISLAALVVSPFAGQLLRANPAGITDPDGFDPLSLTITHTWQVEQTPGLGDFIDLITIGISGEDTPLTGQVVTVPPEAVGFALRVRTEFLDGAGVIETVFSTATQPVANEPDPLPVATPGDDLIIGTVNNDVIDGLGGDDEILGLAGDDTLIGNLGDDTLVGGLGNDTLDGSLGNNILDGGDGADIALFNGVPANFLFALNADNQVEVINNTNPLAPTESVILDVETVRFDNGGVITDFAIADIEAALLISPEVSVAATALDDILIGTAAGETLNGLAGDDQIIALGGDDTLIGGAGSDILDGGTGFDTAEFDGLFGTGDFTFTFDAVGNLVVTDAGPVVPEEDTAINIEQFVFGDAAFTLEQARALVAADDAPTAGDDIIIGTALDDAAPPNAARLTGGLGNDTIIGQAGNDDLRGQGGNDLLIGGLDDDIIRGGGGDDTIVWNANVTNDDGRDVVDGGGQTLVGDTFVINGNDTNEAYHVWAVGDAIAAGFYSAAERDAPFGGPIQIVVTRNGETNGDIIAELRRVEEIVINTGGGMDTVTPHGNFNPTSLSQNTITINGTDGDDTIDLSQITSAHRILFRSNGGNDTIIGELRPQDVVELAPGLTPNNYDDPVFDASTGLWTITQTGGGHSVTYPGAADMQQPQFVGFEPGNRGDLVFSNEDIRELKNIVRDLPSHNTEDHATGVRDLEGTGNNVANPNFGAADQPFIRLTDARYGDNDADGVPTINPIFDGLDARTISNVISTQEADLAPAASEANIFFMAFGQYFDHGLDFLQKGGSGEIAIGTGEDAAFADLTRGSLVRDENGDIVYGPTGEPYHTNKTSPFVDQNQAYGSTELVGQFLRESDGNGGYGAKLLSGGVDPSNADFRLLPTLRELIEHHWDADTVFADPGKAGDGMTLKDYYPGLIDGNGDFDAELVKGLNSDFMGSGHTLVGDANGFINILDHYVAGDLRTNENVTLTSIHTIWARNHNYHVDKLDASGFDGTAEELFQAAKIVNEAEYQRVVFDEFADHLLGGLRGSGSHGFDEYDPNVDASISYEFSGAAYRFGHSLIGQTITVLGDDGQPRDVQLFDAFLNPTNQTDVFQVEGPGGLLTGPDAIAALNQYGYIPQEGYEQLGVSNIVGGIVTQPAEEVDVNVVDAVRDDLVRIHADLAAFNIARGWDLGLGTLNQVRNALNNSGDAYVSEAVDLAGELLTPYTSWEDFQARNGLDDDVLNQFKEAYPDLVLAPEAIAAFMAANPDITLVDGDTVKGIDRVDLWVGGLAEEHINGGVVGSTFWVILHEQFDRLQQGDRHYYTDRVDGFDFYEQVEEQTLADIVARNTGLEGLSDDIFRARDTGDGDGAGDSGDTDTGDVGTGDNTNGDTAGDNGAGANSVIMGTEATLVGTDGQDIIIGGAGNRVFEAGGGDDIITTGSENAVVFGGEGDDFIESNDGNDIVFGGGGIDTIFTGSGNDKVWGGDGDDLIDAGADDDIVFGGAGDDDIEGGAGNDRIWGNEGADRIDGGAGDDRIEGGAGVDTLLGGEGNDTFLFRSIADVNGDRIGDFAPGDHVDLHFLDADDTSDGNNAFTLRQSFTEAGDLIVRFDAEANQTAIEGNTDGDISTAEFSLILDGDRVDELVVNNSIIL